MCNANAGCGWVVDKEQSCDILLGSHCISSYSLALKKSLRQEHLCAKLFLFRENNLYDRNVKKQDSFNTVIDGGKKNTINAAK